MAVKNILIIFITSLLFTACVPKQDDVKSVFQTNSATIIKKDYKDIQKHLISLKKKLDLRNPKSFSKKYEKRIYTLLNEMDGSFVLKYKNQVLTKYKDYLQIAFSKDDIVNRNDYLILGIYYLIHDTYNLNDSHKIGAFEYDEEKLKKMHANLQIIRWKIKYDKDLNGNYLFLTWQNNWQVELQKIFKEEEIIDYSKIKDLKYIKENKETIFSSSNFSFEVLLTQMIDDVENSLQALGEEPKELTVKTLFLFL